MMFNLISFVEAGELDEFVESDVEILRKKLKIAQKSGDNTQVNKLIKKLEKDGVILEVKGTEVTWKWNKWWQKK